MQIQEDVEYDLRRSNLCIIASILEVADGIKKETKIMYDVGCNSKQFKGYKGNLISWNLLERTNETVKRTKKGDKYLELYGSMMSKLENGDSSEPKKPSYNRNGNGYIIRKAGD